MNNYFYKRAVAIIAVLLAAALCFCSCSGSAESAEEKIDDESSETTEEFSVSFIDVGEGDAVYISLPDGKNVLIDCGENDKEGKNFAKIKAVLRERKVKNIDCFILTHTDSDHVGNAVNVAENYSVKKVFIPEVADETLFPAFRRAVAALKNRGAETEISDMYDEIRGDGYFMLFLSPQPSDFFYSFYDELNLSSAPSAEEINNVSPLIYFECLGTRFLFTGDAEQEPQKFVLENARLGLYGENVRLEEIDFFKVPHHGASDAVYKEFLTYINCKNAVISVGGDKVYAHPSDYALYALEECCENYNLYRTDTCGTVSVSGYKNGYRVFTEAD